MYAMASKDDAPIYLNMPTCATVETIDQRKLILEHKDKKLKNISSFNY